MTIWIWDRPDWPGFSWDETSLRSQLAACYRMQGIFDGFARSADGEVNQESQLESLIRNAVRTFAIEGESLDAASVRSSIAERLGIPRAGLPPGTPQTDGVVRILLDATRNHDAPLTPERLRTWHRDLFPTGGNALGELTTGAWRGPGPMRVISGPMGQPRVHYEAPLHDRLEHEIARFMAWFERTRQTAEPDPLIRAGLAHLWMVTLHPFDDGNGRIARAVADLALAQCEARSIRFYAMSSAIMDRRADYYAILEKTQRGSLEVTPWLSWFLDTLEAAMVEAVTAIEAVLQRTRFWQREAVAEINPRQRKVLGKMLERLPNEFAGGINARKYASITRVSKATATRDLTDLRDKGLLRQLEGGGRSTSYVLALPA